MPAAAPTKRALIRWNDDLDKCVLLEIVRTCTTKGLKIPMADVARNMGPVFTEGAIVQHLAKLRNKMDEDNTRDDLQLPVPGKVGRGTVTKPASRAYAKPVPKVNGVPKFAEVSAMNEEELAAAETQRAVKAKGKGKRTKKEMSDDDTAVDEIPTLYDSDADYDAPTTKRARKAKKTTTKKENSVSPKPETKLEIESSEETPVMQTRGIRRNYAQMEGRAEEAAARAIARKSNNAAKAQVKTAYKASVNAGEVNVAADTTKIAKPAAQVNAPAKSSKVVKSCARVDNADKVRESIEPAEYSGAGQSFNADKLDPRAEAFFMELATAPMGHDSAPYGFNDFEFGSTSQLPLMNMPGYGQPSPMDMMTYQAPVYGSYDSSVPLFRTNSDTTNYSIDSAMSNQPLFDGNPSVGTGVDFGAFDMSMNPLSSGGSFDADTDDYVFNRDQYNV